MDEKMGLVLEGGGLRGVYTSGVLDYFMDENIHFPYVIGVSMGACNAASYISKQRGRNKSVNIDYVHDKRYLSYGRLFKEGNLFGMDFIFDEIPKNLAPFDFEEFNKSEQKFVVVATDCHTGKPVYFSKNQCGQGFEVLQASCSLPFISNMLEFDGMKLLDGGLTDSIPIHRAIEDGNERLVIVLTRHAEYEKKPLPFKKMVEFRYRKYPNLVSAILNRYKMYNDTLDYVRNLEKRERAFVIRPEDPLGVRRTERNKKKLDSVYSLGYKDAKRVGEKLMDFLQK